jgi:DNA-binding transcriptional ArsR family regulator
MKNFDLQALESSAVEAETLLTLMANRHRLLVMCNLIDDEMTVSQLLERSSLGQSALSQHLAKLRDANLVATRRDGQKIYYRLASQPAYTLISTLCDLYK